MNYRIIFRVVGRILMAVAAFMLPAMIIGRDGGMIGPIQEEAAVTPTEKSSS